MKKEVKVEQDPINYLSPKERQILEESIRNYPASKIMELRQNAIIIKDKYRVNAFQTNPTSTAIFENATITKIDILNTKRAVTGVNYIAKQMEKEGRTEAKSILEKFSQTHYGDQIIRDSEGLDVFKSIEDYHKFEEAKPASVRESEELLRNEQQYNRLKDRVGTTTPAEGSDSILDLDNGYLSNFQDKEAALNLLKSCIPCDLRIADFSASFSANWDNMLRDLNKKWEELLGMMRALKSFSPGQFSMDLCNLFKFLDGQCIPDITGLISLLSIMQIKYMNLNLTSLSNIINQLVAPFLSPVIGSFTSNLDQYVELIVGPLKCVNRALEQQLINLQEQVNGARNIADLNRTKYQMTQIDFYDAKIKSLRNRLNQIDRQKTETELRAVGATGVDLRLDGDVLTPDRYPSIERGDRDLDRQERIIQTKLIDGGVRIGGTADSIQLPTIKEIGTSSDHNFFKSSLLGEISALEKKKEDLRRKLNENTYKATNFSNAIGMTRATQNALNNLETSYQSLIGKLTNKVNEGINMIQTSIDIYRDEFQRLLLGRVSTQQDQLEFTRMIQEIMSITSIVRVVNDFLLQGLSISKLCKTSAGEAGVLSNVVQGLKKQDNQNMFDFYQALDSEGKPLIVITPNGTTLNLSSVEFDENMEDGLFADANINLDSVTKTVSFNDLGEVDKLNREGIVPDLGNIDGKLIELSTKTRAGSELDLHFKSSYAIISNEFCSKSAINFGSSDTVKQWAASLWQKN